MSVHRGSQKEKGRERSVDGEIIERDKLMIQTDKEREKIDEYINIFR